MIHSKILEAHCQLDIYSRSIPSVWQAFIEASRLSNGESIVGPVMNLVATASKVVASLFVLSKTMRKGSRIMNGAICTLIILSGSRKVHSLWKSGQSCLFLQLMILCISDSTNIVTVGYRAKSHDSLGCSRDGTNL